MKKVAILSGSRIPFVKSMTSYQGQSNQMMLTAVMDDLVKKNHLEGKLIGDVIAGTVMNHPFDFNLTREVVMGSKLDPRTPGLNIQRACGTGLEAANLVALKIASGQIESGIAGGSDTNSDIPLVGQRRLTHFMIKLQNAKSVGDKLKVLASFNPKLLKPEIPAVKEPRTGLSMGEHTELMVKEWKIPRAEQDQLAMESHHKAAKAYEEGFYDDLIVPYNGVSRDAFTRKDTTLEKLAKLRPAFDKSEKGH